jgi:hypothetical protein
MKRKFFQQSTMTVSQKQKPGPSLLIVNKLKIADTNQNEVSLNNKDARTINSHYLTFANYLVLPFI